MRTQLIISADDFGFSHSVNNAVLQAHTEGILTSTSLMVTGDAADEAVRMAAAHPTLAVGLHLTLTMAKSVLPQSEVSHIVGQDSRFVTDPTAAGFKYFFSSSARKELRAEIEEQFRAFADTGLAFSHADGHQHLHVHPVVLPIVLELCAKYRVPGVRIPRDPFFTNLQADHTGIGAKLPVALGHGFMARKALPLIRNSGLAICDAVIGSMMSGRMNEDYVTNMLARIDCRSIELFFHPADPAFDDYAEVTYGPNPVDFKTLLSPTMKAFVLQNEYRLTSYPHLNDGGMEEIRAGD